MVYHVAPDMDYRGRQRRVLEVFDSNKLDALLVTHPVNIQYLCGFSGSAGVLLAHGDDSRLFTDGRYATQAREETAGVRVVIAKGAPLAAAAAWLARARVRRAGVEAERMAVATRSSLAGVLPKSVRPVETHGLIERFRMVKEPAEVERIRTAVLLGAALLDTAVEAIAPGVTETAVAAEIEYAARQAGAESMSFPTIVAAGRRSALPHGRATAQPIPSNGFVVLDFGVILGAYCSDMTRTVHVGRPTRAMRDMYEAVREAQQAGIDAVRPGKAVGEVDQAARSSLRRARLARYFTHSTGHGVGLEIHEPPRLGRDGQEVLQPGMVITIEPGVYVPGQGGVRIEDMVLVTERGCDVLTPAPKELIVL